MMQPRINDLAFVFVVQGLCHQRRRCDLSSPVQTGDHRLGCAATSVPHQLLLNSEAAMQARANI